MIKINIDFKKQKNLISYIILSIILILIDLMLIIIPQLKAIGKINPRIKKISAELKAFSDDKKNLSQLKLNVDNFKKNNEVLRKKIIVEGDVLSLIENISKIGNEENIKITQISPIQEPKEKKLGTISRGDIFAKMININITGGYHNLARFINRLENMDEFVKVIVLNIKFDKQLYTSQVVQLVLGIFIAR